MNAHSAEPIAAIRPASSFDAHRLSIFARRTFQEPFAAQNRPEDMHVYQSSASPRARTIWLGVWNATRAIAFYVNWGFFDVGSHVFVLGSDRQTNAFCGELTR